MSAINVKPHLLNRGQRSREKAKKKERDKESIVRRFSQAVGRSHKPTTVYELAGKWSKDDIFERINRTRGMH